MSARSSAIVTVSGRDAITVQMIDAPAFEAINIPATYSSKCRTKSLWLQGMVIIFQYWEKQHETVDGAGAVDCGDERRRVVGT